VVEGVPADLVEDHGLAARIFAMTCRTSCAAQRRLRRRRQARSSNATATNQRPMRRAQQLHTGRGEDAHGVW
jgi:hypothetical protein